MKVLAVGPSKDLDLSNTAEDRQPGLHLSDVLVRMAWERDRKYHPDAPKPLMVFEQGHTWETVLSRALAARQRRQGYRIEQYQEDGIWCSPDWINPDADIQHEEWKATKKSTKNFEQKVSDWMPQIMSYVRALRRRKLIRRLATRLRVWFINGDYSMDAKGDDLSLLKDYWDIDIEFDRRELDDHWRGVVNYAKRTGLLQEEQPWENRPSLNRTMAARETKRKSGLAPQRSSAKARLVTFRTTKTSPSRRSAS